MNFIVYNVFLLIVVLQSWSRLCNLSFINLCIFSMLFCYVRFILDVCVCTCNCVIIIYIIPSIGATCTMMLRMIAYIPNVRYFCNVGHVSPRFTY